MNHRRGQRPQANQLGLELTVSFIPERRGLKPLANLLAKTARAYALMDVAAMFLSRPEYHAVKLELAAQAPRAHQLYQCRQCQLLFLSSEQVIQHGLAKHFDLFYEGESIQVEPPKGKFMCVARCGLSGALLGPPNHHAFNDSLLEMHRTRFASLPLEEYRAKIINDTDPAAIEQWKQALCQQMIYRPRQPDASAQIFNRRAEAELHFREQQAPTLIRQGKRFVIAGPLSRQIEDPTLKQIIQQAWYRESRFPIKMAMALQAAFRSYGLHTFKTAPKSSFITAIRPQPMAAAQALADIRRILEHLEAHPGLSRADLVAALQGASAPEGPPVAQLINHLRWLIDKGHIIEFMDGKLAVPQQPAPRQPQASPSIQPRMTAASADLT